MIPEQTPLNQQEFEIDIYPSKTYRMDLKNGRITGKIDDLDSMTQAIYKILNTERFDYFAYSTNYGIELADLFGQPMNYVLSELKSRIIEALTWDSRINSVDNFIFEVDKRTVHCTFTAHTIHGDISAERTVVI